MRQAAYDFLCQRFAEPPRSEEVAVIRSLEFVDGAAAIFGEEAARLLREFAEEPGVAAEVAQREKLEFMNLFKVPGPQYVAPYESVFHDSREVDGQPVGGLLLGPSALAVQQWYRLAALDLTPECKELPDHIAVELGYLAQLCALELQFTEAGDAPRLRRCREMQRDFLAAHPCAWTAALAERIRANTSRPYFLALAQMLVDFTRADLSAWENELGPARMTALPSYAPPQG
jgi:TorA maturation chaperone TorD